MRQWEERKAQQEVKKSDEETGFSLLCGTELRVRITPKSEESDK
jgi:hypothetical protein